MFALCVESSHTRGMGHLYRALTLADALKAKGLGVAFLLNDHAPSQEVARKRGYAPITVDVADISHDWETPLIKKHAIKVWVDDRLGTDITHAQRIKEAGIGLTTFDDPGTGAALADLHIAALNALEGKAPQGKKTLQGIDYLILNPAIEKYKRVRTQVNSILVTLGGSDTYGATVTVVKILKELGKSATIVIGAAFEHQQALDAVLTPAFTLKRGVPNMAKEMAGHDLAITGGGITPFEANAAGLPCIIIANESFEMPNGQLLERLGGSVFAGHHSNIDRTIFTRDLPIETMSRKGLESVKLNGVNRVVEALEALL